MMDNGMWFPIGWFLFSCLLFLLLVRNELKHWKTVGKPFDTVEDTNRTYNLPSSEGFEEVRISIHDEQIRRESERSVTDGET